MNQPITKIDITPLVSVALILVIIFIVTAPIIMTPEDSDVQLPKAATNGEKSNNKITITLASDQRVAIDRSWTGKGQIVSALKKELSQDPEQLVLIRADKTVRHSDVLSLLKQVKRAGAARIAIATEQRSRKQ